MKKIMISTLLVFAGILTTIACTTKNADNTAAEETEQKEQKKGEVINMNKAMFIEKVFDYENDSEWKYRGELPAIIDLYADWCGPCRQMSPILKDLAKDYEGKIVIYKVNVDKERELAALFQASSIPLFVFIPQNEEPQLFRGATNKENFIEIIDDFLLGQK